MSSDDDAQPAAKAYRLDTTVAHPARRYNYWLGGKDHFAADRESGDAISAAFPPARAAALENRAFLGRSVRLLTAQLGIRQFLDIGTGIPAPGNTHEVAQALAPESRVVYVDNDPIVLAHARALLNSDPRGATAYLEADLRDYAKILDHPEVTGTLDLTQPVGLLLVAVLHFLPDEEDPHAMVAGLLAALPAGSCLVVSHATTDHTPLRTQVKVGAAIKHGWIFPRTREGVTRFFDGLTLVEPGLVSVADWHAENDPESRLSPADASAWAAVGRVT